jgi:hypothetical protein
LRRLIDAKTALPYQTSIGKLEASLLADIEWWIKFAPLFNGVSVIIDDTPLSLAFLNLIFYTDSSGHACAGVWNDEWFSYQFTGEDKIQLPFIHHRELYAIVCLCRTWKQALTGKTILVYCDNSAAVEAINSGRCIDKIMMKLIRELFYVCALSSFQVRAIHIPGVHNVLADALSRDSLRHKAWTIRPSLNHYPVQPDLPTLQW